MTKILIIEDNLEMRENTSEILELASYEVITADNGKKGVEMAKMHLPDLIICDIMMPEMDGYGVLYLLGKNDDTKNIPFIFLTAKSESSDFRKGMNLGADDYLTKPFEEMELLNAIETRIKRTESFKQRFDNNLEGVTGFIDHAKGIEKLKDLSIDKKPYICKKKEVIFHEGDYPNWLYFINKGKVKTYKVNDDAKEFTVGLYNAGEFIGYEAILNDSNFEVSCASLEESEMIRIPRRDFEALINRDRQVADCFIKMLSNHVFEKEQELINLAYNSVRRRVADALLQFKNKYAPSEHEFKMAMARDDIASLAGTSTESVIRTLSDFKDENLIQIDGSKIQISNLDALKALRN